MTLTLGAFNCAFSGEVNILTTANSTIAMNCLTAVSGLVVIDGYLTNNNVLATIAFPLLTYTAQYLQIFSSFGYNNALTVVDLHSLQYVGQYLTIKSCSGLTALNLPALTYVAQYFVVELNSNLAVLAAPAIVRIACIQSSCINHGYAVNVCSNAASLSYTPAIAHAAAGRTCYLSQSCLASQTCA